MSGHGVCCVIGAGDATGSAVARRFAKEGYTVCVARRTEAALQPLVDQITAQGGRALAFGLDARREDEVVNLFQHIEADIGPIDVLVFNVGGNVRFPVLETTAQKYFKVWEMCALAGFLAGREAARVMLPRGRGTILFTGATASVRGSNGFAAFAGGKPVRTPHAGRGACKKNGAAQPLDPPESPPRRTFPRP